MPSLECPGCGAPEGAYHRRGCRVVPTGVRPCCNTLWYLDYETAHEPLCMGGWGEGNPNGWYLPDLGRDPWHDAAWAD